MNPPDDQNARLQEAERKREEAVAQAFGILERNPDFPTAQVQIHDQGREAEKNSPDIATERLSESRFEYRLKFLDIRGQAYSRLVVDLESHKAFFTVIEYYMRFTWFAFSGIPPEAVPPTLPYATEAPPQLLIYRDRLAKRMEFWMAEGYRQLTSDRTKPTAEPKKQRQILEPRPDLLTNPDGTVSRLKAADVLGISPRSLDRWVKDERLTPIGAGSRKRFKNKDLKRILDENKLDKRDNK